MEVVKPAQVSEGGIGPADVTEEKQNLPNSTDSYTFHIFVVSQLTREVRITSPDHAIDLYKMGIHSPNNPNEMSITSTTTSDNPIIGTATFTPPSFNIDCTLHSHPLTLSKHGLFKSSHTYTSSALAGKTLRWEGWGVLTGGKAVLMDDERNMPLAMLRPHKGFNVYKAGELELLGEAAVDERVRVEVLVTGLALLELRRRRKRDSGDANFAAM